MTNWDDATKLQSPSSFTDPKAANFLMIPQSINSNKNSQLNTNENSGNQISVQSSDKKLP